MAANTHTYNTVEESDESRGNIDRVKAVWDYLGKPYVPTGDLLQAVSLVTELDEQVTKDLDSPLLAALLVFVIEFNNYYPFSASIPEYINIRQQTRSHAVAINKLLAEYFMLPIVPAKALRVGRYEGFPLFKSSAIPKARSLSLFKEETDFELPRLLAKRAGIRLLCREAEELWFAKKDPALREVIKSALEEQRDILAQDSTNRLVKLFRVYKKLEKAGLSAVTPVLQCLKELLNTWNSVTTGQVDFANASVYYSKAASNALQMAHALDVELVAEWNSWYKHFSEASNGLIQFHHSIENLSTFPCSPIKLADILRKELENNPLVYDQFFSAILLLVDDVFGLAWELCQIEEAQVTLGKLLRHLLFEIRTITSLSGLDRVWWAENLAAFVHTLSTRSDPEEIIEKFSQRSDAPELSILVEQFAQKFGGTEQTQGNTGSAAATSQAQTPPLPPNYNNSLVDPWVEYKNASSAGDWVAAEQWLNQIPSTNPYFTEVDKHRNILKESRFFTDFPQLSWVPGKLHSAKHRRNWGEFERLYSDAENIIHAKNPNLTLAKSILEIYEDALKCKDSDVMVFEAEQSVKKGEFIEAGKKVELATQLDLTNTKAVAVEEKASEGIALSSDLKRFRRKTSASKDEILEMLEKARRLYQDIAPNSSEAEGHYRFMQEEVVASSELADTRRQDSVATALLNETFDSPTLPINLSQLNPPIDAEQNTKLLTLTELQELVGLENSGSSDSNPKQFDTMDSTFTFLSVIKENTQQVIQGINENYFSPIEPGQQNNFEYLLAHNRFDLAIKFLQDGQVFDSKNALVLHNYRCILMNSLLKALISLRQGNFSATIGYFEEAEAAIPQLLKFGTEIGSNTPMDFEELTIEVVNNLKMLVDYSYQLALNITRIYVGLSSNMSSPQVVIQSNQDSDTGNRIAWQSFYFQLANLLSGLKNFSFAPSLLRLAAPFSKPLKPHCEAVLSKPDWDEWFLEWEKRSIGVVICISWWPNGTVKLENRSGLLLNDFAGQYVISSPDFNSEKAANEAKEIYTLFQKRQEILVTESYMPDLAFPEKVDFNYLELELNSVLMKWLQPYINEPDNS